MHSPSDYYHIDHKRLVDSWYIARRGIMGKGGRLVLNMWLGLVDDKGRFQKEEEEKMEFSITGLDPPSQHGLKIFL